MQVTGQILSVVPRIDTNTNAQMYWQAHNKTFYTFDMVVQGQNGQVSGEINSTTPNVYPKAAGDQITVEPSTQNGYPKLKAISEQNQQPQQQPQQGYHQQPQQQSQQQAPPVNDVQDNIHFAQALNLASAEYVGCKIEELQIKERARIYYHILKSRAFPTSMSNDAPPPQAPPQQHAPLAQQPQQQAPPPTQPSYGVSELDNDIPFAPCM
jgi:hypothetical protein